MVFRRAVINDPFESIDFMYLSFSFAFLFILLTLLLNYSSRSPMPMFSTPTCEHLTLVPYENI